MTTLKNSLFSLAIALFLLFSPVAKAQDASTITVGGGISYGEKLEEIGLQLNGYYRLTDQIRVGGDFIYWLVDSPKGMSNTWLEINANAHYLFYQQNDLAFYGIGSLGLHYASFEMTFLGQKISDSDTEIGLGLGAGAEYNVGPVKLFAEPRLFLSGFDQFTFSFGVRYDL